MSVLGLFCCTFIQKPGLIFTEAQTLLRVKTPLKESPKYMLSVYFQIEFLYFWSVFYNIYPFGWFAARCIVSMIFDYVLNFLSESGPSP